MRVFRQSEGNISGVPKTLAVARLATNIFVDKIGCIFDHKKNQKLRINIRFEYLSIGIFFFTIFDYFCRISDGDGVIRHIFYDNRSLPNSRPIPNLDTWNNG